MNLFKLTIGRKVLLGMLGFVGFFFLLDYSVGVWGIVAAFVVIIVVSMWIMAGLDDYI